MIVNHSCLFCLLIVVLSLSQITFMEIKLGVEIKKNTNKIIKPIISPWNGPVEVIDGRAYRQITH